MVLDYEPILAVAGLGFYLEDMILVTRDGAEVLTPGLPTTAEEIEEFMKRRRAPVKCQGAGGGTRRVRRAGAGRSPASGARRRRRSGRKMHLEAPRVTESHSAGAEITQPRWKM